MMTNIVRLPYASLGDAKITDVNDRNALYQRALNSIDGRGFQPASIDYGSIAKSRPTLAVGFSVADAGAHASGSILGAVVFPTGYTLEYIGYSAFSGEYSVSGTNVQLVVETTGGTGIEFFTPPATTKTTSAMQSSPVTISSGGMRLKITYTVAPTLKDVAVQLLFSSRLTSN